MFRQSHGKQRTHNSFYEDSVTSRNMQTPAMVHFKGECLDFKAISHISCRKRASVAYTGQVYDSFDSPWALSIEIALTTITCGRA